VHSYPRPIAGDPLRYRWWGEARVAGVAFAQAEGASGPTGI